MTSREQKIDSLRKEIAKLTRELELLESITYLSKELAMLEALPSKISLDDKLNDIEDFKALPKMVRCINNYFPPTVRGFLEMHPNKLLRISGVGPETVKAIIGWMEDNNLKFLSLSETEYEEWKKKNHF